MFLVCQVVSLCEMGLDRAALVAFVNSVSLCGLGLRFCFGCVMMCSFRFCDVGYICLVYVDKCF